MRLPPGRGPLATHLPPPRLAVVAWTEAPAPFLGRDERVPEVDTLPGPDRHWARLPAV